MEGGRWQPYPELGQLQGQLDEGVGACPALLDEPFAELSEETAVEVHVICNALGYFV